MTAKKDDGGAVRLAVVGMGTRGKMFSIVAQAISTAELVGACEVTEVGRKAATEQFSVPVFAEVDEMLAAVQPEAVVIATPDFAHRESAVAAAGAGAHLMIEKPLATSMSDARAIGAAVKAAGVQAMVAFENHWNPVFTQMQSAAAGELGQCLTFNCQGDDRIDVPTERIPWLKDSSPGWFLMSHTVDLSCWISGQRPVRVWARGHKGILAALGAGEWDALHAVIDYDGGMIASLSSSFVLPKSLPLVYQFRLEVVGSAGSMRADMTDQMLHKATDKYEHPTTAGTPVHGEAPLGCPPAQMLIAFVEALAAGEPVPCSIETGLLNVAAVAAIHESAERGEPVDVAV